jgi:hypothetical protein
MSGMDIKAIRRRGLGQAKGARHQHTDKRGRASHLSPAIVEKYLIDMHYSAEKKKLLDNEQNKDAPVNVIDLASKLPNKTYASQIDITKEIGKTE